MKKSHPNSKKNELFNEPDPIFSSWFIFKLTNSLPMRSHPQKRLLVYGVMGQIKRDYRVNPAFLLIFLFQILRPYLWLRIIQFGRKEYRIPIRLQPIKQFKKCIKWVVKAMLLKAGHCFSDKLLLEVQDLLQKNSNVFSWRGNLRAAVKKNRHNLRFRW